MATALQANKNGIKHLMNGNHLTVNDNDEESLACSVPANEEQSCAVPAGNGSCNAEEEAQDVPVVDIEISNVVCSFSVKCHLNLREIALNGSNVEYRREQGVCST
jgi:transcription initiation factor TFIID TATA-box-binding protein